MASTNDRFVEAESRWDLKTLYSDLAAVKGKPLTPVEKLHLRGLLCGYSPAEIAEKLKKNPKGVETDLCATIYKYVKAFLGKGVEKIENWRNIAEWLEDAGYKTQSSAKFQTKDLLPENSVVNISNISIEKNQIVIVFKLQIPTSPDSELSIQNLDINDNNGN
ncbi:helix-turn-helix domain-containing protein [Microcoleus sp. D3_18a_C4]|uniref:helix-turn-helix domain-containing protein n=1 Tax=unclassified Microcoleus TaxID=2642155 RepID=UPI002FCEE8C8